MTEPPPSLLDDLLARGHEFSFDQVMRLARVALGSDKLPELPELPELPNQPWRNHLRIRTDLSLAFPAADVTGVEVGDHGDDETELLVTTTFLGLYGASSPLPTHYTEDLLDEAAAGASVNRDFLDLLHQRLYELYHQCWSKYRLFIRVTEEKNPRDRERLLSLIGLGQQEAREGIPDAWSQVRYAGLFTQRCRSAEGLKTLLRGALGIKNLEIEQCVLRQATIPQDQRICLGISNCTLGVDTVVGSEIPDRMGKFRIHIGPLSNADFNSLLPGTIRHEKLVRLVRLYISDPLEFDIRLTMAAGEARPLILGDPKSALLGLNTWCSAGDTLGQQSVTISPASLPQPAPPDDSAPAGDIQAESHVFAGRESRLLSDVYREELARLRELATNYAKSHPGLASMVGAQQADPGVERLLEGVALLNAHLLMKLNDDFPEITGDLAQTLEPWQMRPIPATAIVAFAAKSGSVKPLSIPAGTEVAARPIEETTCLFRTCFDVTLLPLTLTDATYLEPAGKPPRIVLSFQLHGVPLSEWKAPPLRLFLGGSHAKDCALNLLLLRSLKRIVLRGNDSGSTAELPADCIEAAGLAANEAILAEGCPVSGNLMLQEYFLFPEKHMFLDLHGLERCSELGSGHRFEIAFELNKPPFPVPHIERDSFVLFAVPVVNLFHHKAKSLMMTAESTPQLVRPAGKASDSYQVYAVDRVTALEVGTLAKQTYKPDTPLSKATHDGHLCSITHTRSMTGNGLDTWISLVPSSDGSATAEKKLNIELICTNGSLPKQLVVGGINRPTSTTPEAAQFTNITPVTAMIPPEVRPNLHWRMLGGFSIGTLRLNGVGHLRAFLHQLLPLQGRDQKYLAAYRHRIDGIQEISVTETDRLIKGRLFRGYHVRLTVCGENYSGPGDVFLFCSVLERFLGACVSESCFIMLTAGESNHGLQLEYPARLGGTTLRL
ncbi:hypothetical protein GMSM_39800 [Geomonas sp. Red276]